MTESESTGGDQSSRSHSKHRDHPAHPVLAFFYDCLNAPFERRITRSERQRLLQDVSGRVLDLGAGTGAAFPVLKKRQRQAGAEGKSMRIDAIEPDPHMRRRADRRADELELGVDLRAAMAENLPYADGRFDAVLAFLVLCTVRSPQKALEEAARVLKPGGRLLFIEHVRENAWQDRLTPLWSIFSGGCHLNRETVKTIREEENLEVEDVSDISLPFPFYRLVSGRASKARSV